LLEINLNSRPDEAKRIGQVLVIDNHSGPCNRIWNRRVVNLVGLPLDLLEVACLKIRWRSRTSAEPFLCR